MTTNIDRAAKIIADAFRPAMKGHADSIGGDLARELHKAGVIAADLPAVRVDADNRPQVFVTAIRPGQVGNVRVDKDGAFRTISAWGDPQNAAEARERAYAYLALADALESGDYSPGQTIQGVDQ